MKKLILLVTLLSLACFTISGLAEQEILQSSIPELALEELCIDGTLAKSILSDPARYRIIILHNADPEKDSVRGETWYVRYDALDKENDDSYIVALNEDGSLRFLDIALCDTALAQCPVINFPSLMDQYLEQYGTCDTWTTAAWMAFSVDMCKGRPNGRTAWRIQHAVFAPEPEQAIGREKAIKLAEAACALPGMTAWNCVCLLDGDRFVYKLGLTEGQGWQYMAEIDCLTGEIISVTPYETGRNTWVDCYIPQSLAETLPPAFEEAPVQDVGQTVSHEPVLPNPHTFTGTDYSAENINFTLAPPEAISADTAWQLALKATVECYGISAETLQSFTLDFGYAHHPLDFGGKPYWQFDFQNPNDPLDSYEILLNAQSGEILYLCGPGEGNG